MRAKSFEAIGVRPLYLFVAGLVRERVLPPTQGELGDWTQPELVEASQTTNYFAAANFARAACYFPHFLAFAWIRYWPGFAYVLILFAMHGLLIVVEHYKRALCAMWMPSAPALEGKKPEPEPEAPPGWFRLRRFENESFYRHIGLEYFRLFVTWVMSTLTYGFSGKKMRFIPEPNRSLAVAFERSTRVSETVHWWSALSVSPLVVFSWYKAPLGIAVWSTVIVFGDVLLALLQRYHRARVWPVLKRMVERAR